LSKPEREEVPPFEDFEAGVGTYLKVIRFPEPPNPDGFVVLYLRPNGRFLLVGYWSDMSARLPLVPGRDRALRFA
jgi:hypothetical protein